MNSLAAARVRVRRLEEGGQRKGQVHLFLKIDMKLLINHSAPVDVWSTTLPVILRCSGRSLGKIVSMVSSAVLH
jgi:hypothetical protein